MSRNIQITLDKSLQYNYHSIIKFREVSMTLLEAHRMIIIAKGLGIPELISEAIANHEAEKAKRGRA